MYSQLYKRWEDILYREGGAWVTILGTRYGIEEVGQDGVKITLMLCPSDSMSRCYLIVSEDEFEKLLDSIDKPLMGKVAKIKALLDILNTEFVKSLNFSIIKNAIEPIVVIANVNLPTTYKDGTEVTKDEVEKAVNLFKRKLPWSTQKTE
jgi:hypothetical protein